MSRIVRVLAPNPGPFTLEGTNTWLVGSEPCLVIDPGPADPDHIQAVHRDAGRVGAILLTHRHPDHAPGASLLAERTGAPVMAFRAEGDAARLRDGQVVHGGGVDLTVAHTPGHTPDHVVFHDRGEAVLFTGDAVLGRGTSVIDPPEGELSAYMRSLEAMQELRARVLYPGHGPAVWDGAAKLQEYLDHRRLRERQILDELGEGVRTPEELVPALYAGYPLELYPGAARSVLAHLLKLEREGQVVRTTEDAPRFALTGSEPSDPGRGADEG